MTKPLTLRSSFGAAALLAAAAACVPLTASAAAPLKPGVYIETVSGHAGFIKVEVKLSADRIESVRILEGNETPYIVDEPVAKVIKEVLEGQTLTVDTVSGATRTTAAVLRAVGEAIEAAGGAAAEWTPERVVVDPAALPLKDAP
ncbi:FMN-binding protein, partial [Sutterella sp.]|uniref:FMN-binding protein n=1 Tax=Sutterella sp. TaxID=1981025 RepID=UPI003FD8B8BE